MAADVVRRVLDFWFGKEGSAEFGVKQKRWFKADPDFDAAVTAEFGADFETAAIGGYDSLAGSAQEIGRAHV